MIWPGGHQFPTYGWFDSVRSEEHTSELQSQSNLVCRLLLEKKKTQLGALLHPHTSSPAAAFRHHSYPPADPHGPQPRPTPLPPRRLRTPHTRRSCLIYHSTSRNLSFSAPRHPWAHAGPDRRMDQCNVIADGTQRVQDQAALKKLSSARASC